MQPLAQPCRLLIIEDDSSVRSLLRSYLKDSDFRVLEAATAAEGISTAAEKTPDIILLDLGLPDGDGVELVAELRGWYRGPILIMSGRTQDDVKVSALDAGADDYVTKPFSVVELMARLRVAARRAALVDTVDPVFESGPLKLDHAARLVWLNQEPIKLTPLEYRLLVMLVKHCGKVVTHRQLLSEVWGEEYSEDAQYLRVYMGYLRKKLEPNQEAQKLITTEHRVGYRLML